jgi:hypothetical protein
MAGNALFQSFSLLAHYYRASGGLAGLVPGGGRVTCLHTTDLSPSSVSLANN